MSVFLIILSCRNKLFHKGTRLLIDRFVKRQTTTSAHDRNPREKQSGSFTLEQNYPNPFNPSTTIGYSLPSSAHVRLTVYNVLGQVVSELVNEEQFAGWKEVRWDASHYPSGVYFYRLRAGKFMAMKKMILSK